MNLSEAMFMNLASVLVTAGILYNKLQTVSEEVKRLRDLPEKIARLETEVNNLKENKQ